MLRIGYSFTLVCGLLLAQSGLAFDQTQEHVPGEAIINLKLQPNLTNTNYTLKPLRKSAPQVDHEIAYLVKFKEPLKGEALKQAATSLAKELNATFIEPNYIYSINQMPDDPELDKLYGLINEGQTGGTAGADIKAADAWEITTGSKDIVVGIIDTGVDYEHPDLAANYWNNPGEMGLDEDGVDKSVNGIDDDGNGYVDDFRGWDFYNSDNDPMDDHGHGTHCAGTIGGVGDNGVGVVGVNWQVGLVGIKIFSRFGRTTSAAIIEAIHYTATLGINLTNNSWGGGSFSEGILNAIQENADNGVMFVAAAGNNRRDSDSRPTYPASYDVDNIIAVASFDHNGNRSSFSNYGKSSVHVAAPGSNIYSTKPGGGYQSMSGTSMAAPHVSGLVALVWSAHPELPYNQIRHRVIASATPTPALNPITQTGMVDAAKSVETDTTSPGVPQDISLSDVGSSTLTLEFEAVGDDKNVGTTITYLVKKSAQDIKTPIDWKNAQTMATDGFYDEETNMMTIKVKGLDPEETGFIAVQAVDNVGLTSTPSEPLSFETKR